MTTMELTAHEESLIALTRQLDDEAFRRLLTYARALKSRPPGISGEEAIRIAQEINWDKDDLAEVAAAIKASRQIDPDPEVHFD